MWEHLWIDFSFQNNIFQFEVEQFEGKETIHVFEGAVKQTIIKYMFVSSKVMEREKFSPVQKVLRINKIRTLTNHSVCCHGTDPL